MQHHIIHLCLIIVLSTLASTAFTQTAEPINSMETEVDVSVKVKGITCAADVEMLSGNIRKLNGIISCVPKKKGPVTTFQIQYQSSLVNIEEIHSAIENTEGCKDPKDRPYKVKQ